MNVALRRQLDLYANLRPVFSLPGINSRFASIDLIIVRENTEDLYAGLEHQIVSGVVESLKVITPALPSASRGLPLTMRAVRDATWLPPYTRQTS